MLSINQQSHVLQYTTLYPGSCCFCAGKSSSTSFNTKCFGMDTVARRGRLNQLNLPVEIGDCCGRWNDDPIWPWVKTLVPLVNIKIDGKWVFIPLTLMRIGFDPWPYNVENGCDFLHQNWLVVTGT